MLYSSGIYDAGDDDARGRAAATSYARILDGARTCAGPFAARDRLRLGRVGRGGGRAGRQVRAITISEQQLARPRARIAAAGLADRVEVCFEDYRDTAGTFDRLVSIEMIEAVGEENWPLFFSTIAERLKPGGAGRDPGHHHSRGRFRAVPREPGFHPALHLSGRHVADRRAHAAARRRSGPHVRDRRAVRRLLCARRSPNGGAVSRRHGREIAALGFDERFRRMWLYYLIYCEVGFERGLIDVGLYRMRKPVTDRACATPADKQSTTTMPQDIAPAVSDPEPGPAVRADLVSRRAHAGLGRVRGSVRAVAAALHRRYARALGATACSCSTNGSSTIPARRRRGPGASRRSAPAASARRAPTASAMRRRMRCRQRPHVLSLSAEADDRARSSSPSTTGSTGWATRSRSTARP